jgi:hypothetical protein
VTKSENTQVFVLGGYDGDVIFGDLWRLDLDLLQWNRIPAQAPQRTLFSPLWPYLGSDAYRVAYLILYDMIAEYR